MIIKNIDRIDHLYQFKAKIYDFARTMNSVVASMDITFLQLFAVQVLVLFPFISILFKYEDYFPPVVSQGILFSTQYSGAFLSPTSSIGSESAKLLSTLSLSLSTSS